MKYFIILSALIVLCSCTNKPDAIRILQENGYKNIHVTGWASMSCSKDDTFETAFSATSPSGSRVEGAVCEGLVFKNITIRFK